jgi:predicted nucleic acid-binding protein
VKLVIDNSVVMRWLFNDGSEADCEYAKKISSLVETHDVYVPALFVPEAANVISRAFKAKIINKADTATCFDLINDMAANVVPPEDTSAVMQLTLRAFEDNLSAYDASYLLLAESLNCSLATLDHDLRKAAVKHGVSVACWP